MPTDELWRSERWPVWSGSLLGASKTEIKASRASSEEKVCFQHLRGCWWSSFLCGCCSLLTENCFKVLTMSSISSTEPLAHFHTSILWISLISCELARFLGCRLLESQAPGSHLKLQCSQSGKEDSGLLCYKVKNTTYCPFAPCFSLRSSSKHLWHVTSKKEAHCSLLWLVT